MREIKFRAWDIKAMVMIRSVAVYDDDSIGFHSDIADEIYNQSPPEWVESCGDYWCWILNRNDYELMQFTGLKDANGVEIYEGDIIQSKSERVNLMSGEKTGRFKIENYEVRWEGDKGRWGRWKNDKFELLSGLDKNHMLKWYKVIGSVFENPELLKG